MIKIKIMSRSKQISRQLVYLRNLIWIIFSAIEIKNYAAGLIHFINLPNIVIINSAATKIIFE